MPLLGLALSKVGHTKTHSLSPKKFLPTRHGHSGAKSTWST